jgi:hypothetical protein
VKKIELNLSDEDVKVLLNALERYVSDLSVEIAHTDTRDFREGLKIERTTIQNVLDQLKAKAIK